MTAQWKLDKNWAKVVWDGIIVDNWTNDAIAIGNDAQRKLLEYLIDYCHNHIGIEVDGVSHTTLTKLLKKLEKQQ